LRAGLIQQKDLRLDCECASNTKALLLSAGKRAGGLVELVLHLAPERGALQTLFDGIFDQRTADSVDAQAVGDVIEDGLGERIGFLEHHADAAADAGDVHTEQALAIQQQFAGHAGIADGLVHAVEGAQEGGFAAAGGTDEGGDFVGGNLHAYVVQRLKRSVVKADLFGVKLGHR